MDQYMKKIWVTPVWVAYKGQILISNEIFVPKGTSLPLEKENICVTAGALDDRQFPSGMLSPLRACSKSPYSAANSKNRLQIFQNSSKYHRYSSSFFKIFARFLKLSRRKRDFEQALTLVVMGERVENLFLAKKRNLRMHLQVLKESGRFNFTFYNDETLTAYPDYPLRLVG